jgi:hypothetical protein
MLFRVLLAAGFLTLMYLTVVGFEQGMGRTSASLVTRGLSLCDEGNLRECTKVLEEAVWVRGPFANVGEDWGLVTTALKTLVKVYAEAGDTQSLKEAVVKLDLIRSRNLWGYVAHTFGTAPPERANRIFEHWVASEDRQRRGEL